MRTITLFPLLTALCLLNNSAASPYPGCLKVATPTFTSRDASCAVCYRRKLSYPKSPGCGPLLSSQDRCRFYKYSGNSGASRCVECKTGFALNQRNGACIQGTISRCRAETYETNDTRFCTECETGYYAQLLSSGVSRCVPAGQIQKAVPNCLYGGFTQKTGNFVSTSCARCKPGFSLSSDGQKCETARFAGCLRNAEFGTRCQSCDVYEGYSMQTDFRCVKVGVELDSKGRQVGLF